MSTKEQRVNTSDLDEMFSAWADELEDAEWQNFDNAQLHTFITNKVNYDNEEGSCVAPNHNGNVSSLSTFNSPWSLADIDECSGEPDSLMSDPRAIHEDFTQDSLMLFDLNSYKLHNQSGMLHFYGNGSVSPHSASSDVGTADLPEDVETPRNIHDNSYLDNFPYDSINTTFDDIDSPMQNNENNFNQRVNQESPEGLSIILEEPSLEISDLMLDIHDDFVATSQGVEKDSEVDRNHEASLHNKTNHSRHSLSSLDSLNEDEKMFQPPSGNAPDFDPFYDPLLTNVNENIFGSKDGSIPSTDTLSRLMQSNEKYFDDKTDPFFASTPMPSSIKNKYEIRNDQSLINLDDDDANNFMDLNDENEEVNRLTLGPEFMTNKRLLITDGEFASFDPFASFNNDFDDSNDFSKRLTLRNELLLNEEYLNEEDQMSSMPCEQDSAVDIFNEDAVSSSSYSRKNEIQNINKFDSPDDLKAEYLSPPIRITSHIKVTLASATSNRSSSPVQNEKNLSVLSGATTTATTTTTNKSENILENHVTTLQQERIPITISVASRTSTPTLNEAPLSSWKVMEADVPLSESPPKNNIMESQFHQQNMPVKSTHVPTALTQMTNNELCQLCYKRVYPVERIAANKGIFHKACFRCQKCRNSLSFNNFAQYNNELLCQAHYLERFKATGRYDDNAKTSIDVATSKNEFLVKSPVSNQQDPAAMFTKKPSLVELEGDMKSVQNVRNLWKERDAKALQNSRSSRSSSVFALRKCLSSFTDFSPQGLTSNAISQPTWDDDGSNKSPVNQSDILPPPSNTRQLICKFTQQNDDSTAGKFRKPAGLIQRPRSLGNLLDGDTRQRDEENCNYKHSIKASELPPPGLTKKYAALFTQ